MTSIHLRNLHGPHRPFARIRAAVLSLAVVLVLAACGATDVGLPPDGEDRDGLVGTEPGAVAVVAVEAEGKAGMQALTAGLTSYEFGSDAAASAGGYAVQPSSVGASRSGVPVAEVAFELVEGGEHALWARVFAPALDSDATYLGFNGVTRRVFASELGRYVWIEVGREVLPAGRNVISLAHGEPGLRIDLFAVVARDDVEAADVERLAVPQSPESTPDPSPSPSPSPSLPVRDGLGLRGDPGFVVGSLSGEERVWYERLLVGIEDGSALGMAGRDDLYTYGRSLHAYVQAVLVAFRLTGDLVLLDHVDAIAERMRAKLADEWRGTTDGSDGTRDGYLNWVYRYNDGQSLIGKDTHSANDMKTHALVAMIAYALEVNRDLVSPSGRAYGAHADFWKDYLVNHFEAKWRERTGRASEFPFLMRPHTHTYYSWMKWHYYMGLLTGGSGYTAEAERMAAVLEEEVRAVSTSAGAAYVWPRSVLAEGGGGAYLHPTTYARYVYGDVVEMHMEGFDWWASDEAIERFARTFTELVMDRSDPLSDGFASDVGGGTSMGGFESDPSWGRLSASKFGISSFALISAWDASGRMADVTERAFDRGHGDGGLLLAVGAFMQAF